MNMKMFSEQEIETDLNERLRAVGLDPADPQVVLISGVVKQYFAQRTAEVLERVQAVLAQLAPDKPH
jgi:hypothetical protein